MKKWLLIILTLVFLLLTVFFSNILPNYSLTGWATKGYVCSDSDGGKVAEVKGLTKRKDGGYWTDSCININQVQEGYCDSSSKTGVRTTVITCPRGSFCNTGTGACKRNDICGDGKKHVLEQCDDGNLINGDRCSSSCIIEEDFFKFTKGKNVRIFTQELLNKFIKKKYGSCILEETYKVNPLNNKRVKGYADLGDSIAIIVREDCDMGEVEEPWEPWKLPIKMLVVEFEGKDQFNHGDYCCKKGNTDCIPNYGREECNAGETVYNYVNLLNNPDGFTDLVMNNGQEEVRLYSLFYLNNYIKEEAKKYGKIYDQDIFDIEIKGPYRLNEDPPNKIPKDQTGVREFFQNQSVDKGIDIEGYDSVVFIFLHDYHEVSLYQGFISFASFPDLYISEISQGYSEVTIGGFFHENIHNLGIFLNGQYTTDKYSAPCPRGNYWSCCNLPEGIPEPNKNPLYPQNKACIMCEGIVLAEDGEARSWNDLSELVICSETARELGWIN